MKNPTNGRSGSPWGMFALCTVFGLITLAAAWIGHQPGLGLFGLGVLVAYGLMLALGRRHETLRILAGRASDERWQQIDVLSLATAMRVMALVLVVAFWWSIAHGGSGDPYDWLSAIFAVIYLASLIIRARN